MDEEQTSKPTIGTWDNLPTEEAERKPKVKFDIDKSVRVTFLEENPREYQGDNGAFYCFDVDEITEKEVTEKVIVTAAWTLLHGLKKLSPLKGKTVSITKVMEGGRQQFKVKDQSEETISK